MTQQPAGELRPGQRIPPEDFPTGPDVGAPVPDFTLPDQHGRPVTFSEASAGHRALLVFHRSARW
ncbi:hypothetical protein D3C83_325700 [compost metagenome]